MPLQLKQKHNIMYDSEYHIKEFIFYVLMVVCISLIRQPNHQQKKSFFII